jgi:hypothetical protein
LLVSQAANALITLFLRDSVGKGADVLALAELVKEFAAASMVRESDVIKV